MPPSVMVVIAVTALLVSLGVICGIRRRKDTQLAIVNALPGARRGMCEYRCGWIVALYIEGNDFDDRSAPILGKLAHLEDLQLAYTGISSYGLAALKELPRLKCLWLYDAKMSDSCTDELVELRGLKVLGLRLKRLSPRSLMSLQKLENLVRLTLGSDEEIDQTAVRDLRTELPSCEIAIELEATDEQLQDLLHRCTPP